jgi:hypothetical protein
VASSSKETNDNTFAWSGPSGVLGFTGERRMAPAVGGLHGAQVPSLETVVSLCH